MGNTKSIELINKYRGQIMGAAALWVVIYHTWYRQFTPETVPKILYYMELAISGSASSAPVLRSGCCTGWSAG